MEELKFAKEIKRKARGKNVKRIQEWLSLQGAGPAPDSDFGPATETSVKRFQRKKGLPITGVVDKATFDLLVAPMQAAVKPIAPDGKSVGKLVVAYARQHLKQHPREIGGPNSGPWVRLYMDGNEGAPWAWCAGFACFVLKQATKTAGVAMPIVPSFGVDQLAFSAKDRDRFIKGTSQNRRKVRPGALFLSAKDVPNDWSHVGIFVSASGESFTSIEGNTNDEGSFEGFEVCTRIRGWDKKDFIRI